MRPLRLLHTEASCGWGGQELRVLAEAQGMMRRGHSIWIAAPAESRIYSEAVKREIPAAPLPIARKGLAGVFSLRSFIARTAIEIINTHSSTDAWLSALACIGLRGAPPLVRTRHISAPLPSSPLTRWLYSSASAHLVTTGEALREQLIREAHVSSERVTSVPTGVDLSVFRPGDRDQARASLGIPGDVFVVVIVATLRSWKGHRYLVEAMARVEDAHLLIVGDGPGRENLRAQVESLRLAGRVHFSGHQDHVAPWLQCADVAALPSYANEGVPQSLMQAMACGIPVVTTAVGAIGEIVQDGVQGIVVPPRDVEALSHALRRLRDDRGLRQSLGAAGLAQARERFSLERMLDAMEAVFAGVLERPPGARVQAAH